MKNLVYLEDSNHTRDELKKIIGKPNSLFQSFTYLQVDLKTKEWLNLPIHQILYNNYDVITIEELKNKL